MSADRSWTITPTLTWFGGLLVAGLWVFDGGVQALSDRLTHRREPAVVAPAGLAFTPSPRSVEEADQTPTAPADLPPAAVPIGAGGSDRSRGSTLEDTCLEGTPTACTRWAMDGFYRAIAAERAGTLGRAVRVSWYGDSIIATDSLPARLRTRLQGELGDGGPGFVYVIPPHRFCHHEAVRHANDGRWKTYAISTVPVADGIYGAGGSTTETVDGTATLALARGTASRVTLHYLAQPRGGTATVKADGAEVLKVTTRADAKQGASSAHAIAGGASRFVVEARGRLRVFGLELENPSGAVVDNFGIVSVRARSFANHDIAHYTQELERRAADLIIVMIGTNEAQWLGSGEAAINRYQALYEQVLSPVRTARPGASCLVLAPTDQAEVAEGRYRSRPVMPALVDAQRRAARARGCAFFSTYDWMGGKGAAVKWGKRGLVGSDFTHLSRKGSNKVADAVFEDLIAGYRRYADG